MTKSGDKMTEIKPCPFCGGKASVRVRQLGFCGINEFGQKLVRRHIYVACNDCHSRGKYVLFKGYPKGYAIPFDIQEEAVELWNRRV